MPKDGFTEGTPSLVIVPDDINVEGTRNVPGKVTLNGCFSKNTYSVHKKPIFSPITKATSSQIHIGNSFSILEKEVEPVNKSFPQKKI